MNEYKKRPYRFTGRAIVLRYYGARFRSSLGGARYTQLSSQLKRPQGACRGALTQEKTATTSQFTWLTCWNHIAQSFAGTALLQN